MSPAIDVPIVLAVPVPVKVALWLAVAKLAATQHRAAAARLRVLGAAGVDACRRPLMVFGGKGYSALDLIALPALLGVLWFASGAVTRAVCARVPRHGDGAAQDTFALLARYALVLLGGIVVLQQWGVDVQALTVAASVLGVGIGFGLQHIANNFVSGLLVGAERPIRPGDYVTRAASSAARPPTGSSASCACRATRRSSSAAVCSRSAASAWPGGRGEKRCCRRGQRRRSGVARAGSPGEAPCMIARGARARDRQGRGGAPRWRGCDGLLCLGARVPSSAQLDGYRPALELARPTNGTTGRRR